MIMKNNICFVAPISSSAGGIAVWFNHVQSICKRNGVSYEVIDTLPKIYKTSKRNVFDKYFVSFFRVFSQKRRLKRIINQKHPHIIHIATSGGLGFYRDLQLIRIAKKHSLKTIIHFHFGRVSEIMMKKSGFEYKQLKKILKSVDKTIAIDNNTYETLKRLSINVTCINNPVKNQINSFSLESRDFIFVGRVSEKKGSYELINAFSKFLTTHPNYNIKFIGKIDKEFLDLINNKLPKAKVFGPLSHEETLQEISTSMCLLLPSYTEGMPNVILEAMSFGIPCIATKVGSIPNVLNNVGLLINPKDEEGLLKSLKQITDDNLRKTLSLLSHERIIKDYSIEKVGEQLMKMWTE